MRLGDTIGDRIRYFRLKKAWSQTRLWKAAGLGQTRLSKIENGISHSYSWELERIAFYLGVPLNAFDTLRQYVDPALTQPAVATTAKDPAAGEEPGESRADAGPGL